PKDGTFIDLDERKLYISGVVQEGLDVPKCDIPYNTDAEVWVPSNDGSETPKHFIEDYKRFLSYYNDEWSSTGCCVEVYVIIKTPFGDKGGHNIQKVTLGSDSLWGIESDSDEGYKKEVESDVTQTAKIEALKVINVIRNIPEDKLREMFLGVYNE
ncbi:MAG: hypothetical protein KAS32_21265, partial [Candidatus Peribacteraceae bacterium]|nr:hypothetical protein [Candidatus Peribacteraceae bacterium]